MDDAEFFRGIEGSKQNEEDFSIGAEHLLRLKKQVGLEPNNYSDLGVEKKAYQEQEIPKGIEKNAGELSAILASTPPPVVCHGCKKEKNACLCKMASILKSARDKTAGSMGVVRDTLRNNPTLRAAALGGATSGTVGAAMGAATTPQDRLGGAWKGGWTGAASGAGGGALYHHLNDKLAEMRQKTANALIDAVKNIDPNLLKTTGLGALLGGAGTYLASRPQKDTGKSRAEEELEGKVNSQRNQPERGLLSKMHHRNTELEHGYAKAFREHPVGAAMIGAATGAAGGYGIGRLAGALSSLRGGR